MQCVWCKHIKGINSIFPATFGQALTTPLICQAHTTALTCAASMLQVVHETRVHVSVVILNECRSLPLPFLCV